MTAQLAAPPDPLNAKHREETLARLTETTFDLLVIGAGITGAAIARDAAMRGLSTLLVDKGDLACGTSSASSKLAHGGLRYLEQGRLGLVLESVSERNRLSRLAPHLVRPIPFVFPVYERKPKPLWMVNLGLWIYDAMSMFRSYRLHSRHGSKATAELEPALRREGLDGSIRYYDCITDDARLTLENARSAHLSGASVLTYCEVVSLNTRRARVSGAQFRDRLSDQQHSVEARSVVNATGPWTDRTLGLRGDRSRLLRPTKGVHVIVSRERLPVRHAVVLTSPDDRRVVFAVPWENEVMLGTTDTDFQGDFDVVYTQAHDVEYLLELTNQFFPQARLRPEDIVGSYAGLRPLVSEEGDPSSVSREHAIREDEDGLITIAGGKLTTHRIMAAEVLDVVAEQFRREGTRIGGCHTGAVPLPGGSSIAFRDDRLVSEGLSLPHRFEEDCVALLGEDVVEHLKQSYGGFWADVAARTGAAEELAQRIAPPLPYVWAELEYAVENELCLRLSDFMRRRTQLEIRDFDAAMRLAPTICTKMAAMLGWNEQRARAELKDFSDTAEANMAWRADMETETIRA
tara:strand:+ start:2030 stop:3751 length:1722 start_codon:yes stop_codon:yes gene_type:complete